MTTTFDPTGLNAHFTLSNGDLTATHDGTANQALIKTTTYKTVGKWYCEFSLVVTSGTRPAFGLANSSMVNTDQLGNPHGYAYTYFSSTGQAQGLGSSTPYGSSVAFTTGDVISLLWDASAGTVIYWRNGAPLGTAFTGVTGSWVPVFGAFSTAIAVTANFGATAFVYTPPAGYTGIDGGPAVIDFAGVAPTPALVTGFDGMVLAAPKSALVTGFNGMVLTAPKPTLVVDIPIYGILATAPKPTAVITSEIGTAIAAVLSAPAPTFTGSITPSATIGAVLTAPAPSTSSYGVNGEALIVVTAAPAPVLVATMSSPIVIAATVLAPAARLSAHALTGNVASILATAATPIMAAAGYPAYMITMGVTASAPYLLATMSAVVASAYRTWVLNTKKGALTEYGSEWAMNSYAVFNGKVLGCTSSGIVELGTQDLDNTMAINSTVKSGQDNFGTSVIKRLPRVYLSHTAAGDAQFKLITIEGGSRTYALNWNNVTGAQQRRIPVGKGPKSVRWQWEYTNVAGADFDIDAVLAYPQALRRRVQ